jgi:hypothetical protein
MVRSQIDREQQQVYRTIYDEMDTKALILPNIVHGRTPSAQMAIPYTILASLAEF